MGEGSDFLEGEQPGMCSDADKRLTCEWPSFAASRLAHLHCFRREKEVTAEMILSNSAVINKPFEPGWVTGVGFGSVHAVGS